MFWPEYETVGIKSMNEKGLDPDAVCVPDSPFLLSPASNEPGGHACMYMWRLPRSFDSIVPSLCEKWV